MRTTLLLSTLFVILISCDQKCKTLPEAEKLRKDIDVQNFDSEILKLQDSSDVINWLEKEKLFADKFLQQYGYADQQVLYRQMLGIKDDPYLDSLRFQTNKLFESQSAWVNDLEMLFAYTKYYFPNFFIPKVGTVITGFNTDLFYDDSLLVISLDYFATQNTTYKPDIPQYMMDRYYPQSIAAITGLLISSEYNEINELDQSLLAEMIYYGKAYYFLQKVLPCVADTTLLGYSTEELAQIERIKSTAWSYILEKEHLFKSEHRIVNKYVGERPYIAEIGPECPGRIGRWFGLQMVKNYAKKHPEMSLSQIMAMPDAKQMFQESKYKP
jgi:hypothetical protein